METQKNHVGSGDGIPLESVEAWSAPVFIWEAEPVVGGKNTVPHGCSHAGSNIGGGIVVNERGVVIPRRTKGGNALMTLISISWRQLRALPRCQWKGQLEVDR